MGNFGQIAIYIYATSNYFGWLLMKNAKAFAIALGIVVVLIAIMMILSPATGYLSLPASTPKVSGGAVLCSSYDKDKDGYVEENPTTLNKCWPLDCNDNDAKINSGVPEIYGDKIDNDCDGKINEVEPQIVQLSYSWKPRVGMEIGKNPDKVCQTYYASKGAIFAAYRVQIRYYKTLDDCKNGGVPTETESALLPFSDQIVDYSKTCGVNGMNLPGFTGISGISSIDSWVVMTCWR